MKPYPAESHRFPRLLLYLIYCLCVAGVLLLFTVKNYESFDGMKNLRGFDGFRRARFPDMIYGKAYKPWVFRALLPITVRGITYLVPDSIKAQARDYANESITVKETLGWDPDYFPEYVIALLVMFLSLLGFAFALRCLFSENYESPGMVKELVPVFALLGLPVFFRYYSYIYDFPTLFFFTLGLLLIVRNRWYVYYPVFILGCINKETTILLTVIFAIHAFKKGENKNRIAWHVGLQCLIFFMIKFILMIIYKDNPGWFVCSGIWFLSRNMQKIAMLYTVPNLVCYSVIAVLIFYRWSSKPAFLKQGLWIIIPLVLLAMYMGYVDELRDYYEIYPIIFLLMTHSIGDILGLKIITIKGGRSKD